jgi:hypothetical protein
MLATIFPLLGFLALCGRRPAYAHDCVWLMEQLAVGECTLDDTGNQALTCRKNPAEDYFCAATTHAFWQNGTYFTAHITCSFPGYRDDGCHYYITLFTEASMDWPNPGSHTCTDDCSPLEDHGGTDVAIVIVGATIGGIGLICVIAVIVRLIRRDANADTISTAEIEGLHMFPNEEEEYVYELPPEEEEANDRHNHHEHHHHHHHHGHHHGHHHQKKGHHHDDTAS